MNYFNKIISGSAVLLAMGVNLGCNSKNLNIPPPTVSEVSYFSNENEFKTAIFGCYALLSDYYSSSNIPGGSGSAANNLPGCTASDDFSHQLGDPGETMLATALQYRATGSCPAASLKREQREAKPVLVRSPARENRILRRLSGGAKSGQAYRQQAPDA